MRHRLARGRAGSPFVLGWIARRLRISARLPSPSFARRLPGPRSGSGTRFAIVRHGDLVGGQSQRCVFRVGGGSAVAGCGTYPCMRGPFSARLIAMTLSFAGLYRMLTTA